MRMEKRCRAALCHRTPYSKGNLERLAARLVFTFMNSPLSSLLVFLAIAAPPLSATAQTNARGTGTVVDITTARSALKLFVGGDGRVYQAGYGGVNEKFAVTNRPARELEFHPQYGTGYVYEPALQATHADGN